MACEDHRGDPALPLLSAFESSVKGPRYQPAHGGRIDRYYREGTATLTASDCLQRSTPAHAFNPGDEPYGLEDDGNCVGNET